MKGENWSYEGDSYNPERELHIRHLRYEEAKEKTLNWIDDLYNSSMEWGIIVHGASRGTLKEMVYEILKKDKRIKLHKPQGLSLKNPGAVWFSFF